MASKIEWTPSHDEAGNLLSLKGSLIDLEFTIVKAEPPEGKWVEWKLVGPLWNGPEFLCTNAQYWTAMEYAENLIASKLTQLAATFD